MLGFRRARNIVPARGLIDFPSSLHDLSQDESIWKFLKNISKTLCAASYVTGRGQQYEDVTHGVWIPAN